jgi:dUTP pyrophosphatase
VIVNSPGTIDADYPDEWCVPVKNGGVAPLVIRHGERIAQMVLMRFETLPFEFGQVGRTTERAGGFGSTGR